MASGRSWPATSADVENLLQDPQACAAWLDGLWTSARFRCARCGGTHGWMSSRKLRICRDCACHQSVLSGTVFHGSRQPANRMLAAVWWLASARIAPTARMLMHDLNLPAYSDARSWMHRLDRLACIQNQTLRPRGSHALGVYTVAMSRNRQPLAFLLGTQRLSGSGMVSRAGIVTIHPLAGGWPDQADLLEVRARYDASAHILVEQELSSLLPQDAGFAHGCARMEPGPEREPHLEATRRLLDAWLHSALKGRTAPDHVTGTLARWVCIHNLQSVRNRIGSFLRLVALAIRHREEA